FGTGVGCFLGCWLGRCSCWRSLLLRFAGARLALALIETLDQLDHSHGGVVTLARPDLGDSGVAAVTVVVRRSNRGEELVHDSLVVDHRHHPTPRREIAAFGERDQAFGERTKPLGLGLCRRDAA